MEELRFLEEQNVSPELIKRVEEFRQAYPVKEEAAGRITKPAPDRTESDRQEYPCREPGIYF